MRNTRLRELIEHYLISILAALSSLLILTLIFLIINSFAIRERLETQYSVLQNYVTHDISQLIKIQKCSAELILFYSRYIVDADFSTAALKRPPRQVARELSDHIIRSRRISKLADPAVLKLFEENDPLGYTQRIGPMVEHFYGTLDKLEEVTDSLIDTATPVEELDALTAFQDLYDSIAADLNLVSDSLGQLQNIYINRIREANRASFRSERIFGLTVIAVFLLVPLLLLVSYRNSKKLNRSLTSSLHEEELRNQEINHRVKNNLLLISSLIRLKKESGEVDQNFAELETQIDTIRLVHEQLYTQTGSGQIDMQKYIFRLLGTIFTAFDNGIIQPECSIEPIEIDSRIAVPLGLIINEVATNTIKYGFTGDRPPRFSLEFVRSSEQNSYCLTIANTGPPISDEIDPDRSKTLGLRLVKALVGQLKGSLEVEKQPHPKFIIQFTIKPGSDS